MIMRHKHLIPLTCLAAVLAAFLLGNRLLTSSTAAEPSAYAELTALTGGKTLLEAAVGELVAAVRSRIQEKPKSAGETVYTVLSMGRSDTDAIAPEIVRTAILALGKDPSSSAIGRIVAAAVKAAPGAVLKIVKAAIHAAPPKAGSVIVWAAIQNVPNPDEMIEVPSSDGTHQHATDGKGDYKEYKNYKEYKESPEGNYKPLRDAILDAAREANPDLEYYPVDPFDLEIGSFDKIPDPLPPFPFPSPTPTPTVSPPTPPEPSPVSR